MFEVKYKQSFAIISWQAFVIYNNVNMVQNYYFPSKTKFSFGIFF